MKFARPPVSEERWMTLAARYPALRADIEKSGRCGGWKTSTVLARCLGVILAFVGAGLLAGFLRFFPEPTLISGLVMIGTAEFLVASRRIYRSGVEEALYAIGAMAVIGQLFIWNAIDDESLGIALASGALLLVGWRLLNPVITTLGAAVCSLAIAWFDSHLLGNDMNPLAAATFCAVLWLGALIAGGRIWQRPSHDRMLDGLVILMPWLAFVYLSVHFEQRNEHGYVLLLAVALIFAAVTLAVGIKRHQHAPLISAMGSLVCAAYPLYKLLHWPLHWRMIACGAVLLIVAAVLDRLLRKRTEGITSRSTDEEVELLQLASAAPLVPVPAAVPSGVQGQGGEFGGGGASGRF